MDSSVSPKNEIWFLRVCHHIPNAVYLHYLSFYSYQCPMTQAAVHAIATSVSLTVHYNLRRRDPMQWNDTLKWKSVELCLIILTSIKKSRDRRTYIDNFHIDNRVFKHSIYFFRGLWNAKRISGTVMNVSVCNQICALRKPGHKTETHYKM